MSLPVDGENAPLPWPLETGEEVVWLLTLRLEVLLSKILDVPCWSLLVVAHWGVSDEFDSGRPCDDGSVGDNDKDDAPMPLNPGSGYYHHDKPRSNCPVGNTCRNDVVPMLREGVRISRVAAYGFALL